MGRKSAAQVKPDNSAVIEALEHIKAIIEIRYEMAREAYDMQDETMQKVIDQMVRRLRLSTTGYVNVRLTKRGPVTQARLEQEYVDFNLMYVAVEILKDLALMDIKVGTFKFPEAMCISCGAPVTAEKPKRKGGRK